MKVNYQDLGLLRDNSVESINKAIIVPAKDALRQLRTLATGNMAIRDNQYAAIITLGYTGNSTQTLTSGTEYTFQNPLKTAPIGFTPIKCVDANGVALSVDGFNLNTARTDGLLGITLQMFSSTGYVGETVKSFLAVGSAISITTTAETTVTSITLGPGTWDMNGVCALRGTLTGTIFACGISATTNTLPTNGDDQVRTPTMSTAASNIVQVIPQVRVVTTASGSKFLVIAATFSAGTATAYGRISAVRASLVGNGITGIVTGILWGG